MCQGVVKIDQRKGKHHGLAEYLCRGRGSDQVGPFLSLPTGEPVGAEIDRVLRNRVLAGETGCGRGDATTMEGNWNWVGQPRVRLGWWAHGVE
jgi:hypothetical protein